jgi:hypothetical protein
MAIDSSYHLAITKPTEKRNEHPGGLGYRFPSTGSRASMCFESSTLSSVLRERVT